MGNNGVEFSERDTTVPVSTCFYGQNNGWPYSFGCGVSIPTKGNYGTLNIAVQNASGSVSAVSIGFGNIWTEIYHV